ncbi:Uncharacterised protein [Yersinia massiliensis]|uniref:MrpH family fimbial adhesin n=1 Tax=Yersinia massiliensis TaxID=419257 RepID=UPI0005E2B62B|nr:hypothetical protein [Yersinia massiliensis]CNH65429.1 Uncharacterised protein [Yersinia massiliensis]
MMKNMTHLVITLYLLLAATADGAITVDASTRRVSGSFSAYDSPYELTRTGVRIGANNFAFDIVAGYQGSSRCIPPTNATALPAGCVAVRNGNQTQNTVTYAQVANFANQYINAGLVIPAGINLNAVNTLIVCHGAVPRASTVVRKCLSATLPAAVVEPPCTIGTAPITINHGPINANVASGHVASNYLSIQCKTGQYIQLTPAATNGVTLRSDGSLKTKITVNDSTQANGGALIYIYGGGYELVKISSTLSTPYGYVTAGAFSGSTVLTVNVI